jgi:AcrR family transcriptional regulator
MSSPSRPRDASATRQAILDAAEGQFAQLGPAGARVDEIAKASGYNKSLIFQYFGDKDGLYRAVLRRCRETSDAAFRTAVHAEEILQTPLTPALLRATLERSVGWVFDHFLEHPNFLHLFSWEMALGWAVFKQSTQELEPSFAFGLEVLRRAQAAGLLRPGLTPETIVTNVLNLPFVTLAGDGRFGRLREAEDMLALREQTIAFVLSAVLE